MSDLEHYIQGYFGLEKVDVSEISDLFKEKTIEKNEFFCRENSSCNKLAFVKTGAFRMSALTEKKEVTQWISTQGEFITDLSSLLFKSNSRWSIQALYNSSVYEISAYNYSRLKEYEPKWPELEKLFLAKCFITLENRTFSLLSMTAEERYIHFCETKEELFNKIPHHYIASMLGMTPETLSRIRAKLLS